jgi:hypothetical protein
VQRSVEKHKKSVAQVRTAQARRKLYMIRYIARGKRTATSYCRSLFFRAMYIQQQHQGQPFDSGNAVKCAYLLVAKRHVLFENHTSTKTPNIHIRLLHQAGAASWYDGPVMTELMRIRSLSYILLSTSLARIRCFNA